MSDTEQLVLGGVRSCVVFINQQTAGEGAGSPLPPDQLTGFLTYLFLCLHVCVRVCVWAKIKLLNLIKWLYFSLYPSVSGVTSSVVGRFQEVHNLAVK